MPCIDIYSILSTPDYYPLKIDFRRQLMLFVRMSRDTYRESVFLDHRTKALTQEFYEVRLDDLFLVIRTLHPPPKRSHYILQTTYCCSTLLCRYLELLPTCFVLKEPLLLTQLAYIVDKSTPMWINLFRACTYLLARTYTQQEIVMTKTHEPCNVLGKRMLETNELAAITFLRAPLKSFLLSILKSPERRRWVRRRVSQEGANLAGGAKLEDIVGIDLSDAQAAACLWLVNNNIYSALSEDSRVSLVESEQVTKRPSDVLRNIFRSCNLPLEESDIESIVSHSIGQQYSKDLSKPYDAESRLRELTDLEGRFGDEANEGIEWAHSHL